MQDKSLPCKIRAGTMQGKGGIRRGPPFSFLRQSYGRVGGFFVRPQTSFFAFLGEREYRLGMADETPKNAVEVSDRDSKGRFVAGNKGGPGMPIGHKCGRARALATLDSLFEEEGTQARLKEALREAFEKNPVKFFRQILMPLMPQSAAEMVRVLLEMMSFLVAETPCL